MRAKAMLCRNVAARQFMPTVRGSDAPELQLAVSVGLRHSNEAATSALERPGSQAFDVLALSNFPVTPDLSLSF